MKFKLSMIYFFMFAFIGIHMPFWPLWLQYKHMTAFEISILTALAFTLKIIFTPIVGKYTDKHQNKKQMVILLSLGLLISFYSFNFVDSFMNILIITFIAFMCWSPIMALNESITTLYSKEHSVNYGHIRMWGAIAFAITVMLSGTILSRLNDSILLPAIIIISFLLFVSACFLPTQSVKTPKEEDINFRCFLSNKNLWFILFLLASTLIQGSHAALYTYGTIEWKSHGISDTLIGILWGIGFGADILIFYYGKNLVEGFGAFNVVVLGGVSAMIRWIIIGNTINIPLLIIAQLLQAFSFAGAHFAAMKIIMSYVDKSLSATAQSLYSSFIMGLGMGIFVLFSGYLYADLQDNIFNIMAFIALLGTISALSIKLCKINLITIKQG